MDDIKPAKSLIPGELKQIILMVSIYACRADRWVDVKQELIDQCPSWLRTYFSRRNEISKKHTTNSMELEIVEMWRQITGVELEMPETDRSLPKLSKNGQYAWNFLTKRYPRGMKELFRKDVDKK